MGVARPPRIDLVRDALLTKGVRHPPGLPERFRSTFARRQVDIPGSQYVQMGCAFTLMVLVYLNVVEVYHILLLSFVAGVPVTVTETPLKEMVCPEVKPVPFAMTLGVGSVSSTTCHSVGEVNCSV